MEVFFRILKIFIEDISPMFQEFLLVLIIKSVEYRTNLHLSYEFIYFFDLNVT